MTTEFYKAAYAILVKFGRADPRHTDAFVREFTEESKNVSGYIEWRFQGKFGFGGKFWRRPNGYNDGTPTYNHDVNYYAEDRTEERDNLQADINDRLATLEGR